VGCSRLLHAALGSSELLSCSNLLSADLRCSVSSGSELPGLLWIALACFGLPWAALGCLCCSGLLCAASGSSSHLWPLLCAALCFSALLWTVLRAALRCSALLLWAAPYCLGLAALRCSCRPVVKVV
jgi:hypothetical protein